jgi:hypothetical protein
MHGIKCVFVVRPAHSSTSTHPKFIFGWSVIIERTIWKENRIRKAGIQHLPFKVHSRNFLSWNPTSTHLKLIPGTFWEGNFERNMGQEKQESKIYHPRFILTSAVPGQVRKTVDRIYARARDKTEYWKGCLGLSVYLWCVVPIPLHLPIQNSFFVIF